MLRFAGLVFILVNFSTTFAYYGTPAPETTPQAPVNTATNAVMLPELPPLPDFMALEKEISDIIELSNMPAMPAPNKSRAILPSQTMTYPQFSKRGRFYNSRFQRIPFPVATSAPAPAMTYGKPTANAAEEKPEAMTDKDMAATNSTTAIDKPVAEEATADAKRTTVERVAKVENAEGSDAGSVEKEVLQVVDSSLGKIYADSRGFTLYTYSADSEGVSTCTGGCAVAWPPYLVEENQSANMEKLSEITRPDGEKQWAFAGKPLYFYAADRAAGETKGDKVANVWFVVSAE